MLFDNLKAVEFTPAESEYPEPKYHEIPKSPYATPEIGARMLKEGIDEYYEDEIYIWYHLTYYDGWKDLELEMLDEDSTGDAPQWWFEEMDGSVDYNLIPNRFNEAGILRWSMTQGIFPGQPFAVRVSRPEYYRCSYEYVEYDMDVTVEVVRIGQPRKGVKYLEEILAGIAAYPILEEKRRKANELARWEMTERMHIRSSSYFPSRQHYHDMAMPQGYQVSLCSSLSNVDEPERHMSNTLVSVRSDEGDHKAAWRELENKVAERRPDLVPEGLKAMRHFR